MLTTARVSSVVAVSAALIWSVALPATAADTAPAPANTTATVSVLGGSLAISAPASTSFDSVAPGATTTVLLSGVKVTDTRAGNTGWVAKVASSDFIGGIANNKIPASAALYTPLAAVPTGVATVVPGAPVALSSTAQPAQTATVVVGNNTATWTANLLLTVPANALADTYTATLTHSVL